MDATSHQNWYQWTDGTEVVSIAGSVTDASVQAYRTTPSQPEIGAGEVGVDVYDVAFGLDAGTVASEPVPGDTLTDSASAVYTVLNVRTASVGPTPVTYHCQCRKQVSTT